ncbi:MULTISPECIES: GNAT family N-acetyltransferase [Lactobacillus]|uniref:N-acetyltransferase YafP n=2 Tax=Lactobacillus helveticus TaxID=1587 RepID=A0A9Q5G8V7_LACHE|nr:MULTISPECIES: GNAT family N-acetyltransferase [Lactobacillus]KRL30598.1 GNAT family acetyltransferase [Lactobacillus kefiranofaciens subsp. kefirgranum DSM 10550 = JCM 8572]MCJ2172057.1 GNAT family N-acetyltransferase [Lactobacillus kefiranofaciens]MDH5099809.1 GNAT family N-acetyltransferase [Lactobacillus kefiranofaciens]NRN93768.1 putative N-acetyltransferase YafP [Lactobacillus helveticus]NRO23168.1 putative N-acetyltransferase YafP [Lactobacillus helveticus]
MDVEIKKYDKQYFDQLCSVMDRARMQELKSAGLEQVFLSLRDAPYLGYLLDCEIYVAVKEGKLLGFVGLRAHELSFIYVDPDYQKQGIGNELMKVAVSHLEKPVKLDVFTDNIAAKSLYQKYGFKTVKTVTEKWSDDYPVDFSQDTMELQ